MQTFAVFIAESFNSSAVLVWSHPRHSYSTATFSVEGIRVTVSFEQREATGPWHVAFEVGHSDSTAAVHSAFEVFNGVFQAAEKFIDTREPDTVVFVAKRKNLADIYQTFLLRGSDTFEKLGYKLEMPHRIDTPVEFTLKRIEARTRGYLKR